MQYPVIDLITSAYINNGWTGLDISTGKNLFNPLNATTSAFLLENNTFSNISTDTLNYFRPSLQILNNNTLIATYGYPDTHAPGSIIQTFTINEPHTTIRIKHNGSSQDLRIDYPFSEQGTFTVSYYAYSVNPSVVDGLVLENIQLEAGSEATPYEPYGYEKNDFPNRLKLPLPHYFPHPVIDALQRAAAGTQTADDTEILRHYLTPLGIGGI